MPKSNMQLPLWPDKMSEFHGKITEKSAKKKTRLFYLVGKSYSTLIYTNTLLEMPHRDTGRVVRTRLKKFMKMSKMILLK